MKKKSEVGQVLCSNCHHEPHPKGDCSVKVTDAAEDLDWCSCQSRKYGQIGYPENTEEITVEDCIRWIRKNCMVDTGGEIYGDANRYTEEQILNAIKKKSGK